MIKYNTINDSDFGIYLIGSQSYNNNISNNYNISSNDLDGIYITGDNSNDIFNNTITWNGRTGINCTSSTEPTIKSNDIENNTWYGVWSGGGSDPVINYNNIANNGAVDGYGVYNNDDEIEIDAKDNWWGDASGPYHPTKNPTGTGDEVSDDVEFEPYSDHKI
jgi:parallel beta-helix repeat protein